MIDTICQIGIVVILVVVLKYNCNEVEKLKLQVILLKQMLKSMEKQDATN